MLDPAQGLAGFSGQGISEQTISEQTKPNSVIYTHKVGKDNPPPPSVRHNQLTQTPSIKHHSADLSLSSSGQYEYDERGNRIRARFGYGAVQVLYRYDGQNQLTAMEYVTAGQVTKRLDFSYDSLGRRLAKTVTTYRQGKAEHSKKVNFLYLGDVLLAEEVQHAPAGEEFEAPSFKTPEVIYIHRPGSFEPLMQLRPNPAKGEQWTRQHPQTGEEETITFTPPPEYPNHLRM